MYEAKEIALRIKSTAKLKKLTIRDMLDSCGLSKNTLASMNANSIPKADNLAMIADLLNVSVDYLLGRTDKPDINK